MAANKRIPLGGRAISRGAATRIGLSALNGAVWGIGWAMCVETYRGESNCVIFICVFSPIQVAGLGLLLAAGAVVTLVVVYHLRQPFLRALLCALLAACLMAFLFYLGLTLLAPVFQSVSPVQLEEWLLPLGWGLDNAALWLVMQHVDAPKQLGVRLEMSRTCNSIRVQRKILFRLLLIVLLGGLWLGFAVARSVVSIGMMLAIIPPMVWGGLALTEEI